MSRRYASELPFICVGETGGAAVDDGPDDRPGAGVGGGDSKEVNRV